MLYREIIAVCSEIHTKHINTLCGQKVELLNVKPGGTYSKRGLRGGCYVRARWSASFTDKPISNRYLNKHQFFLNEVTRA
jgi:hypothetical protein